MGGASLKWLVDLCMKNIMTAIMIGLAGFGVFFYSAVETVIIRQINANTYQDTRHYIFVDGESNPIKGLTGMRHMPNPRLNNGGDMPAKSPQARTVIELAITLKQDVKSLTFRSPSNDIVSIAVQTSNSAPSLEWPANEQVVLSGIQSWRKGEVHTILVLVNGILGGFTLQANSGEPLQDRMDRLSSSVARAAAFGAGAVILFVSLFAFGMKRILDLSDVNDRQNAILNEVMTKNQDQDRKLSDILTKSLADVTAVLRKLQDTVQAIPDRLSEGAKRRGGEDRDRDWFSGAASPPGASEAGQGPGDYRNKRSNVDDIFANGARGT
jgi:hypothetical protein